MAELYVVRAELEGLAAKLAAKHATDEEKRVLLDMVDNDRPIMGDPTALSSRDVRVFIDDKPEPNSKLRKRFRPKGFLIILIGKDGQIKLRKNSPWSARELTRIIDKGS